MILLQAEIDARVLTNTDVVRATDFCALERRVHCPIRSVQRWPRAKAPDRDTCTRGDRRRVADYPPG